jgi:hypothetical protein
MTMIRAWHTLCTIRWPEHLAEVSCCAWGRIKLPFWVYTVGGVFVDAVAEVSFVNWMLSALACRMWVGAGRNLVKISLGFASVLTPIIITFLSK